MEYIYILALLIGFLAAALLGPVFIPVLIKLKFGQSIREIGPKWHEKKSGTQISKEQFRKYWIIASGIMAVIAVLGLVLGWV